MGSIFFKKEWEDHDLASYTSDQIRTTNEICKAMSSLVPYLKFEGEVGEMFPNSQLPTLDTTIWWEGSEFLYKFFEKKTVPNRVLQRQTALSDDSIRSSLVQEVVRRLLNCSKNLPILEKQEILSTFSQKLINSGFSLQSSQLILVHGVTRYLELVRKSSLPSDHKEYKPLYWDKNFKRLERKIAKFEAKTGWYDPKSGSKSHISAY